MDYQERLEFVNETELNIIAQFYPELLNHEGEFGVIYDTKIHNDKTEYTMQKYGTYAEIEQMFETEYSKLNQASKYFNFQILKIDNRDIKWLELIVSTSLSRWIPNYIEKQNIIDV